MVLVRRATSWRAATSLLLLSMSAAARDIFVVASVATDARLLAVVVAKLEIVSTVSCRYTRIVA